MDAIMECNPKAPSFFWYTFLNFNTSDMKLKQLFPVNYWYLVDILMF